MATHRHLNRPFASRATRRGILKSSLAGGTGLALAGTGSHGVRFAGAQTPGAFDRDASITSWGFGLNNPLATARADAFKEAFPSIDIEFVPEVMIRRFSRRRLRTTFPT